MLSFLVGGHETRHDLLGTATRREQRQALGPVRNVGQRLGRDGPGIGASPGDDRTDRQELRGHGDAPLGAIPIRRIPSHDRERHLVSSRQSSIQALPGRSAHQGARQAPTLRSAVADQSSTNEPGTGGRTKRFDLGDSTLRPLRWQTVAAVLIGIVGLGVVAAMASRGLPERASEGGPAPVDITDQSDR